MNQRQQTQQTVTQEQESSRTLERVLTETQKRVQQVNHSVESREDKIEDLLPDFMKGQSKRLIERAKLTFAKSAVLQECTPASFVKCVLEAAELGFAIDGRMCHAVPHNNKKKDANGNERWVKEARLNVDYKGLVAVAKRQRTVRDCWARVVLKCDTFTFDESDASQHYSYTPDLSASRDNVSDDVILGVLSVATHEDGWHRVDWMPWTDVCAIRARSPSSKGFSPWKSDPGEMGKKTGIRRLLKTFSDDPGLIRAFELDDQSITLDAVVDETIKRSPPRSVSEFKRLASTPDHDMTSGDDARDPEPTPEATTQPQTSAEPKQAQSDPDEPPTPEEVAQVFIAKIGKRRSKGGIDEDLEAAMKEIHSLPANDDEKMAAQRLVVEASDRRTDEISGKESGGLFPQE